jgi:hypothetical protein
MGNSWASGVLARVRTYVRTYTWLVYVLYHVKNNWEVQALTYYRMLCHNFQLSDWKRAHMCTENHVCFGRRHGSRLSLHSRYALTASM